MNVLIVDDEPHARKRIRRLLADYPDLVVVAESNSGPSALEAARTHRVDVILLDVQMAGMDGFEVVRALANGDPPIVVFVTAHDTHALRAFEVAAIDYVVKPVRKERLVAALDRARVLLASRESAAVGERLQKMLAELGANARSGVPPALPHHPGAARLEVRDGESILFLPVAEIDWLEADGPIVRVHAGRAVYGVRDTLSRMEESLDQATFVRIHRSFIVNLERVRELQPWFGGDALLVLREGQKLKVSRTYRTQLRDRLNAV